jgi:inorganic pyrophosphatase
VDDVTAVIETPKGSANKYDYDDGCSAFRLSAVMPEGTTFPYDFGIVPSTVSEDGDPLDVLIFLDAPVVVGCVLTVRLIGVIEAKQRKKGEDWIRNDRLLAVATLAHSHEHVQAIGDLRPRLVDEIEAFFFHYDQMNGKEFKTVSRGGQREPGSSSSRARRHSKRSWQPTATRSSTSGAISARDHVMSRLDAERDQIRTRTAEGRSRAKARGQHIGRPSKLTERRSRRPADTAPKVLHSRSWPRATMSGWRRFHGFSHERVS